MKGEARNELEGKTSRPTPAVSTTRGDYRDQPARVKVLWILAALTLKYGLPPRLCERLRRIVPVLSHPDWGMFLEFRI